MTEIRGFLTPPRDASSDEPGALRSAIRSLSSILARALQGGINVTNEITLTAGAGSTTLTDARISPQSFIEFAPQTSNAAVEKAAGSLYVSQRVNGSATIVHANNAQTDRTFTVLIIG